MNCVLSPRLSVRCPRKSVSFLAANVYEPGTGFAVMIKRSGAVPR
jgi:hypothetical protein